MLKCVGVCADCRILLSHIFFAFSFSLRIFIERKIIKIFTNTDILRGVSKETEMNGMSREKEMNGKERQNTRKNSPSSRLWKMFFFFFLFSVLRTYVKHKFVKRQKGEFSAYIHSTYCCLL